jgi:molybdopterin-biosynthesis enzyme MoeA-like protein
MNSAIGLILIGDELLSGKRRDAHLANAARIAGERGMDIDWVRIEHDDLTRLTDVFRETMASGIIVFSYGGIGATPDDVTRAAAAAAAGVPLVRHPEIAAALEERYGEEAHPYRIRMAEIPEGAGLIPNPPYLVPGFYLGDQHFLPGFPDMAAGMLTRTLDERYKDLRRMRPVEQLLEIQGVPESELVPHMDRILAGFPGLRLSSLPAADAGGSWLVEIGLKGPPAEVDAAIKQLQGELDERGAAWRLGARL